jgi:hypothetical protein
VNAAAGRKQCHFIRIECALRYHHSPPTKNPRNERDKEPYSSLFNGEQCLLLLEDPTSSYPSPDFVGDGELSGVLARSAVEAALVDPLPTKRDPMEQKQRHG